MIELGELPSTPGETPDGDPAPAPDPRLVRKLLAGAATLLCALTVTGSVRPRPHNVRPLWSVPVIGTDNTTLTRDTVYLHHTVDGQGRLTAYEPGTGAVRWSRSTGARLGVEAYFQLAPAVGMLLMPSGRQAVTPIDGTGPTEVNLGTVAVHAATGAQLWIAPGDAREVHGDTALMADYTDRAELRRLRLIRLRDQGAIWSLDTSGVHAYAVAMAGDRPQRLVTATEAGEIGVFRYADGTRLTSARIPWQVTRPAEGLFTDMTVADGHLVVSRSRPGRTDLTVYVLDTLARAWSAPGTRGYAFACGVSLCLNEGDDVMAYDPATGTRRWRVSGSYSAWSVRHDRVVLEDDGTGQHLLLDAATGARIGERAAGEIAWDSGPRSALILLRPTASLPMRTAVSTWDLATGRLHLLGAIDHLFGCQAAGRYLACRSVDELEISTLGLPVTSAG